MSPAELAALGDPKSPSSALFGAVATNTCQTEPAPEGAVGVLGEQAGQQPLEHAGQQTAPAGQASDTEAEVELMGPSASTPVSNEFEG